MLKSSVIFKVMPNTPSLIGEGFSGILHAFNILCIRIII